MIKKSERYVQRGQIAELRFWTEALRRGVVVSRPHHGARYDFIVDCGSRLWRVQVKSTSAIVQRTFRVNVFSTISRRYKPSEVDFIAAYVTPRKEWYIIPMKALKGKMAAVLTPTGKLGKYREAWHLLLNRRRGARIELQATSGRASAQPEQNITVAAPKAAATKPGSTGLTLYGVVESVIEKKR